MLLPFKFSSRIKSDLSTTITILYDSVFVYVFMITRELYIFVCFCVMANILSTWTPFSSSCKAALVLMNSLSFCLSGNFVYQEKKLFFKVGLARYSVLGWQLFSFSILNVPSHSLLPCNVSADISAHNHMEVPLYVASLFSLAAPSVPCLWLLIVWLMVCLGIGLSEFILLGVLWIWIWMSISCLRFGKLSAKFS